MGEYPQDLIEQVAEAVRGEQWQSPQNIARLTIDAVRTWDATHIDQPGPREVTMGDAMEDLYGVPFFSPSHRTGFSNDATSVSVYDYGEEGPYAVGNKGKQVLTCLTPSGVDGWEFGHDLMFCYEARAYPQTLKDAAQPGPREVVVPEWVTHISISKGYPGTNEEPWMANLTGVPEETPYYTSLRGFGDTPSAALVDALVPTPDPEDDDD